MRSDIRRYSSLEALSREACEKLYTLAVRSIKEREVFTLALSGGKTPRTLYELLARPPLSTALPWDRIHFFWGDERCVASNHPHSNYAMAFQSMLSRINIPRRNIHRIPVESGSPKAVAEAYETTLRNFFSPLGPSGLDLIILGTGPDGHTASLFPGSEALDEEKRWVAAVHAPEGFVPQDRITLTLPFINAASNAWFLVSGVEKTAIVEAILSSSGNPQAPYPAAKVNPRDQLSWFICSTPA